MFSGVGKCLRKYLQLKGKVMKKKVTVIGYGGQGGWHAAHALESDVVSLLGIYDIDDAKIKLAQSRGIKTYESLDAALADPECDIVVVATPNDVHKEIVVKALNAGKNVICEKPVEMTVKAFDENMEEITLEGTELLARAICHETDHLHGKMYTELVEGDLRRTNYEEDEEE